MQRLCRRAGSQQSQARPAARPRRRIDVADWLKGLGPAQYAAAFRENDITEDATPVPASLQRERRPDVGGGEIVPDEQ
jgi:hypothetical protein